MGSFRAKLDEPRSRGRTLAGPLAAGRARRAAGDKGPHARNEPRGVRDPAGAPPDRVLASILFTDIVDSTRRVSELGDQAWRQLRERHDAIARDAFRRFRGNEVKHTGDGFVASFDGPARAIRCACSIREAAREHRIEIRAGVHSGECDLVGDDLSGLAVHIAARVGGLAGAGEVLVSGTVKDLIIGSGIDLVERGTHELKGVPGSWQLFAVGADDRAAVAG